MKYKKIFWTIMLIFFLIFISILFASNSGYYEYENINKKVLTEEKMKEFEDDVKNGKSIDLKNYFIENDKKYENKVTGFGDILSSIITDGVEKGLEESVKLFEKLVE